MPVRSSLNVSLTPALQRFVEACVENGRYQTASEVIREGLRLLEEREREREAAFDALKGKLKRAARQAERGDLVDGKRFFAQLFKRLERKQLKRKSNAA